MRWTVALFVCFVLPIVLARFARPINKQVEATCRINMEEDSLEMEYFLEFEGDPAEEFYALSGTRYVYNSDGSDNTAFCQYEGSFSTWVFVRSVVYRNGRPDENPCGLIRIPGQSSEYTWYFAPREHGSGQVFTDIDVTYSVTCTFDGSINNLLTIPATVVEYDDEHVPRRVRPENQMSILQRPLGSPQFVQAVDLKIRRDQEVKLLVRTKAKNNNFRNVALDHYGSYVFSCDYRNRLSDARTLFIQSNGCPNAVYNMLGGFRYARVDPIQDIQYVWYESESSPFIMAPSTSPPEVTSYYITCYVDYCYGVQFSDPQCNDYCGFNSRKRRSVNDTLTSDRINVVVNIVDDDEEIVTSAPIVADKSTMLLAIVSGISFIILAGVIVVVLLICLRRGRARDNTDTSSTTDSNVNLPHHVVYPAKNPNF
ncbi:hypothetical protein ACF0H5_004780 [Mactra antiquata]